MNVTTTEIRTRHKIFYVFFFVCIPFVRAQNEAIVRMNHHWDILC